jgi:glycosyltransferase involved in cell wall biosynthesis
VRLVLVTRCLDFGGAERQLVELARGLHDRGHAVLVISLYPGPLGEELAAAGVPWMCAHKRGRWDMLGPLRRVRAAAAGFRPEVVHGYLSSGNLVALFLARALGARVVFGIRSSHLDLSCEGRFVRVASLVESWALRAADLIIVNSFAGRETVDPDRRRRDRVRVVHNGIDIERFRPRSDERACDPTRAIVVGAVGRLHPQKGMPTLLAAMAQAVDVDPRLRVRCVGDGDPAVIADLRRRSVDLGISERISFENARSDIETVYPDLDILVSASVGESFPNVVAEAMACGIPAVVTDVGDSALIVGDTGVVVEPGNQQQLADAVLRLVSVLDTRASDVGRACRSRIVDRFATSTLLTRTEDLLVALAAPAVGRR